MHLNYLPDRTPITPLGVVIGDRILAVHTEGEEVEEVDLTVTSKGVEKVEDGHYRVTVGYVEDGGTKHREFDDPGQWLSVEPRTVAAPKDVFEVAA